jgi:succinate dehydrogenase / fumarate reductase cytochrome b subunit
MAQGSRPLSPHLQIYRPQLTSILSILHRFTGVGLALGAVLFAYWIAAAAYGADAFQRANALIVSGFGRLVFFGLTFAFFYHFANGLRHLAWDAGFGFDLKTLNRSGIAVVAASFVATFAVWAWAYAAAGKL